MPGRDIGTIDELASAENFETARFPIAPLVTGVWNGRAITGEDLRERLEQMSSPDVEFSVDGTQNWHDTFASADRYFRIRAGEDAPWTGAIPVGGGITGGGFSVGTAFPASADTDTMFLFSAANNSIVAKDTDGTTDKTSAERLDLFRYDGTNWIYVGFLGDADMPDVQFILPGSVIPSTGKAGELLWFLEERTGLTGFVDTDGSTAVTSASDGDIFQRSGTQWIKRLNVNAGGGTGGSSVVDLRTNFRNPAADGSEDLKFGITSDAIYKVAIRSTASQAATGDWSTYSDTGYLGAFYSNPTYVDGSTYFNTRYRSFRRAEHGGWFFTGFPAGWLGYFNSRDAALQASTTTGNGVAYTGRQIERLTNFVAAGTVTSRREWALLAHTSEDDGHNPDLHFGERFIAGPKEGDIFTFEGTVTNPAQDAGGNTVTVVDQADQAVTAVAFGDVFRYSADNTRWERKSKGGETYTLSLNERALSLTADFGGNVQTVILPSSGSGGGGGNQEITTRGQLQATSSVLPVGTNTHGTLTTVTWTVDGSAASDVQPNATDAYLLELPHKRPNNQVLGVEAVAFLGDVETDSAFLPWGPGAVTEDTTAIDHMVGTLNFSDDVRVDIYYSQPETGKSTLKLRGEGQAIPANATVRIYLAGAFGSAIESPEVVFDNLDGTDSPNPTTTTLPADYKNYSHLSISSAVGSSAGTEIWTNTFPTAMLGSQTGAVNRGRIAGTLDFTFNATTRELVVTSGGLRYVVLYNAAGAPDARYTLTLIAAAADIPDSPTTGDVIRATSAITTSIPTTVKGRDGTTTETALGIGDEFRWDGTNWLKIGDGGGGGSTFTPSQANLYDAVKAILHPSDQSAVTADDANNEIDITDTNTVFSPTKANLYDAVKAILVHSGSSAAAADDPNNQIDVTHFAPTQQNIYDAVKAVFHPTTQSAVSADDTNHELDITDTDTVFTPSQQNLYDAVKAIIVHSASPGASADDTANEIDITGSVTNPVQTTAPASPTTGQLWFDSSENEQKQWDGSAWQTFDYEEAAANGVLTEVGSADVNTAANTAVDTTIDLSSYNDLDVFMINFSSPYQLRVPIIFPKNQLPTSTVGTAIDASGLFIINGVRVSSQNISLYFAITAAGNLLFSAGSSVVDPMPMKVYRFNPVGGSSGGSGTTFSPTKSNLYNAVKEILHPSDQAAVAADDANNEIDITGTAFTPSQSNLYSAVKAIFHPADQTAVTADDTNMELDISGTGGGNVSLTEVANANVNVATSFVAVSTTIDLSSYDDEAVFFAKVERTGWTQLTPISFTKYDLPVRAVGANLTTATTRGLTFADAVGRDGISGANNVYFAITSAGILLFSAASNVLDPAPLTVYQLTGGGGSGGTTFTPSQANLYDSVKAILHPSDQSAVTADDTNMEIDIATGGSGTGAITVVTASNVTQATASPNTIEITLSPTPAAYVFGQMYLLETKETNTDEMIFKIAGLNNRPLVKANGDAMGAGDLTDERLILVAYNQDLGRFEVLNPFEVLNLETIENIEYNIQQLQNAVTHGAVGIGDILTNFIRGATVTAEVHDTTTDTQILPGSVFQFLKRYMPQGNAPRNISNEIAEQFTTALLTERLDLPGSDPDLRRFIIRAPIEYEAVPRVVIGGEFWWDDSQRTPQPITGFPNSTGSQLTNESGEFFYNIISLKKRSHATGEFPHRDPAQYWTTAIALKVGDDPYAGVPHYAGYSTGGQTVSTAVNTYLGTTNGSPEYDVAAGATESALVFDGLTQKSGGYNITFNVKVGEVETSVDFPMTGLTYNNDRAAASFTTSGTFRDETGEHTTSVPLTIAYNGTSHNFTVSVTNNFAQAISVSAYYQRNIDLLEGTTSSNMTFVNYAYSNIDAGTLTSADVSLTQGNWIKWILLLFEDSSTGRLWGKAAFRDDTTDYYNIPTLDFNYQNEEIDLSEFLLGGNVGMRHVQGYYLKTTIAEDSLPTHAQLGALLTADTATSLVYGKVSETSETTVNIAERVNFTDIAINGDDFDPDDYVESTTLDDYATEAYADAQASTLEHWTPVGNPTGDIGELKVENGGTGYSGVLTVTITPDSRDTNAQDATASATRTGGAISAISLNRRGNGYTHPPTVTVTGSTGGSGAVISSTVRLPLGTPAVPMGNIDYRAWDSSNGRWNINYNGRNPNRSPIYWRNPNIDWTRFGCNLDLEHNSRNNGNAQGALSFGWGFADNETPGWSGAGSNGMALWFNRFHNDNEADHGYINGFFLINLASWANMLATSRIHNFANNTCHILRHTVSGNYYTFHNGAIASTQILTNEAGNASNVFWQIPVNDARYKMRIVGAGNKVFVYVNQVLYLEITFPINMPTNMGPRFVMMGDSGQQSGLRGYLYEIGVGAPDPADMMQGYTSGTLSNPFPTPIGDLWATSADFPTGEVLPTTLAWTVPTTAPTGIADGSGTYLNLPNVRPDHNNTKTQGLYVALYGDTDVLSDELFIPWGARIADDANEDGRYRLDHDTGYIALEYDGTGLMMTTFSSPSSVLEGYYLEVRQWKLN